MQFLVAKGFLSQAAKFQNIQFASREAGGFFAWVGIKRPRENLALPERKILTRTAGSGGWERCRPGSARGAASGQVGLRAITNWLSLQKR